MKANVKPKSLPKISDYEQQQQALKEQAKKWIDKLAITEVHFNQGDEDNRGSSIVSVVIKGYENN